MSVFLTDAEFEEFRKLIYSESGITFSETNRSVLESRIREILRTKKLASVQEYFRLVSSDKDELTSLLDSVTTNLTRFFRNQAHFDALANYVLPEIIQRKSGSIDKKIRVWSAGCSTGEEPYTIAMVLKDKLPPSFQAEIVASDISLKCLMVAKTGFYSDDKVSGVPANYLPRFFEKKSGGWQVKKELMDMIRFDYHNLAHESHLSNIDIVFCRNVIIYFDEAAQKSVIDSFWRAMANKSYLFIGHSESLFGMDTQFVFLKTEWACLYQKNI